MRLWRLEFLQQDTYGESDCQSVGSGTSARLCLGSQIVKTERCDIRERLSSPLIHEKAATSVENRVPCVR